MTARASPKENVVLLRVGFDLYTAIVAGIGDGPGPRAAYDGKVLELMSPPTEHEQYRLALARRDPPGILALNKTKPAIEAAREERNA